MNALDVLYGNYPELTPCGRDIEAAYSILKESLGNGGTVYLAGNGGSCADADHISGELLKGFLKKRPLSAEDALRLEDISAEDGAYLAKKLQQGLRSVSLMHLTAPMSAVGNDLGGDLAQAQLLLALARKGDVLLGISTSGNARNIALACHVARLRGVKIIGMTGEGGGRLKALADCCIRVPASETFRVQEYHLPVYHALCAMVEDHFFKE